MFKLYGLLPALACFALSLGACSKTQFETILLSNKYIPSNETRELKVPPSFGAAIPQDSLGRPFRSFHMDMYEFPNNPAVDSEDPEVAEPGSLPLVNVNYYEAQEMCEQFGKRLCTIYEWRQACLSDGAGQTKAESSGNAGYVYPYTGEYDRDTCVTDTSSADRVGSRSTCISTFSSVSVYDLSGNVWEWVNHDFYGQSDQFGGKQAIVGGYYFSGQDATCELNLIVDTDFANERTGFRCCRDAEREAP